MKLSYKVIYDALLIIALIITSGCTYTGKVIDYQELSALIQDENAMQTTALIDVRTSAEWKAGYIEHAINIEYALLVDSSGRLINNGEALISIVTDKATRLIIYGSGNDNAWRFAAKASQLGYADISLYTGGIQDWKSNGDYLVMAYDGFRAWYDAECPFDGGENYLVDVNLHDAMYINYGHIPGAINITSPYFSNEEEGEKALKDTISNKDAQVVFYCLGPSCPSSRISSEFAVSLGYTNVFKYLGGMQEWKSEGNELIKGEDPGPCAP